MSLAPGTKLGPYEILSLLGAGGMGEVWRARDVRVDRAVALKVLPEEFFESEERRARFAREAKLLASLNHPNVAVLYSFEEIPRSTSSSASTMHVLVMELLEGGTLRAHLQAGSLPVRKALDLAVQMAKGLAAAHAKGIVHRDLKPENVFVTPDGRVKLLDFGLAKAAGGGPDGRRTEADTVSAMTEAGAVMGTAGYMSPEQVRGEPADHRSDIFSFGTILYELLTGKNPFRRDTHPETMTAILKEDPPLLSDSERPVSPPLSRIVARCLEKSPEARFQGAADLAFGLETLTSTSISPPAEPAPGTTRRPRILGWRNAAAAAGLLLALAGAYFVGARGASSPPPSFHRLTFRRGFIGGARFSPDGQTILYGAAWDGGPFHVYSTRIGNPETSPVTPFSAMLLGVSRAGDLALLLNPWFPGWRMEGTLAQAPFAGGSPREILRNVSEADWAPDGSTLAVARLEKESFRLELLPGTLLYERKGRIACPRFSRDGTRVAFLDLPALFENYGDVSVVDRSGRMTVLSKGWRSLGSLAWSPRGDEIWFSGSRTGRAQSLHAVSLSGRERVVARWGGGWGLQDVSRDGRALFTHGGMRMITTVTTPAGERDLSWFDWSKLMDLTPDGKLVLLVERGVAVGGKNVAYLRNTDGSPAVRLGEGYPFALSPDGKWVVVLRNYPSLPLVVLPTGVGREMTLPSGALTELGSVEFFPGGKKILIGAAAKDGRDGLWVQDLDGSVPRPFGPDGLFYPRVSPDGRRIAALGDASALRILTEDGKVQQSVAFPTKTTLIGWAQDGSSLYVGRAAKGLSAWVDRLNLATGRLEPWREFRSVDPAGVIGPPRAPEHITPDGKNAASTYVRVLNDLYLVEGLK